MGKPARSSEIGALDSFFSKDVKHKVHQTLEPCFTKLTQKRTRDITTVSQDFLQNFWRKSGSRLRAAFLIPSGHLELQWLWIKIASVERHFDEK